MSGRYYVKKHRREKQTKECTPQFVIRRVHPGSGLISWQGRYYNLYKTFSNEGDCLQFVESLLNGDVSQLTRSMVMTKHHIDKKHREIYVEVKGLFESDNTYFIEKFQGDWPSDVHVENFLQSCFVSWIILFKRLNSDYINKLYQRKQIGFRNADRLENNRAA